MTTWTEARPHARPYRGRFAPSPSGPLHLGSAVAAIASWLDAKAHEGCWLLRIDDVDTTRTQPGADRMILDELRRLELEPDEAVSFQSDQQGGYETALHALRAAGKVFDCGCTRRSAGPGPYPGTCRHGLPAGTTARSVRAVVDDARISFCDRLCGPQRVDLARESGAFIVRRADGLIAYHLACVVDDQAAGITHVVRGDDLLSSTPAQVHLQQLLGYRTPSYLHFPVLHGEDGLKLSKQNHAPPTTALAANEIWRKACGFLGLLEPGELVHAPVSSYKLVAVERWLARFVDLSA